MVSDNSTLRAHRPENVSENNLVNDVNPNKPCIPVDDMRSCDKSVSTKILSFLYWNVCGWLFKFSDNDFIIYINSFDFFCLVETFLEEFDSSLFSTYTVYCKPAIKLSKQGRRSGGVLYMIRNSFVSLVKPVLNWANVCSRT